ncbi:MAG: hydrogenase 3 maturation endopeptidase HyCI [candidate division WOR-3 bacterium]|nr:MAG: hydrogenase 3 maturation endopeptidase HyCI [candidate division WOR-3 bacterium]
MDRAVVVGVGNRMKGDDAVGCLVADELTAPEKAFQAKVYDAGTAPENYIEPIVELDPDRVLFIDACAFGGEPGEFRLFGREEMDRLAAGLVSTHTLPLSMTAALLGQQTKATIQLLGIQPQSLEFDAGLSEPVSRAMPGIVEFVKVWVAG